MKNFAILGLLLGLLVIAALACSEASAAPEIEVPDAYEPSVDAANFTASTVIDHRYFPLVPGTISIFEGKEDDDTIRIEEHVTSETRRVLGIDTVVVRVQEWINGELAEDTLDWYAQDNEGNVWYFGEDSKDYEKGKLVGTEGSWEAGVDGAKPGIIMKAEPQVGQAYRQEYWKGEAEDMGEVIRVNDSTSVRYGSFEGVVVIKEWAPLEPDVVEHDYYAPGVGPILEVVVKGGSERIELVEKTTN